MNTTKTNIITVDGDGNFILQDVTIHGQINISTSNEEEIKVFLNNHSEEQIAVLQKMIEPLKAITFDNKQKVQEIDTKIAENAEKIKSAEEDALKNSGKKIEKELVKPVVKSIEKTAEFAKNVGKESEKAAKEVAKITKKGAKEVKKGVQKGTKEIKKGVKKATNKVKKLFK